MAGVIVTILKIIGIVLVSILSLLLILIGVFLFLPVRYQLKGSKDAEKAALSLSVNWLCHLFRIRVKYEQDSGFVYSVKLLFFQLFPQKEKPEQKNEPGQKNEPKQKNEPEQKNELEQKVEVKEDFPAAEQKTIKQPDKTVEIRDTKHKSADKKAENSNKRKKETFTFQKICDKIKGICSSCEKFKKFITSEDVKGSLKFLNEQRKYLVRHLKPSKADVYIHFGTEDPALTGQILAVLSVLYPFYGYKLDIEPDFEQAVFEGSVFIKGKAQFYVVLLTLWRGYKNHYIRKMIDRVRK